MIWPSTNNPNKHANPSAELSGVILAGAVVRRGRPEAQMIQLVFH